MHFWSIKGVYFLQNANKTRSSWLNCALRDDEAVFWVSIGHYEAVAVSKDTRNCQEKVKKTRSSWLNCALRDDEAVFWASIGHYETVAVSNW